MSNTTTKVPNVNLKPNGVERFLSLSEAQRLFLDVEKYFNSLITIYNGSPWNNPNIPTSAEKAALTELTAGTGSVDNGLLIFKSDGGLVYDSNGNVLEKVNP